MSVKETILSVFSVAIKIVIIIVAGMLIYKYAVIGYDYAYRVFGEKPVSSGEGRAVSVTISSSMDTEDIGKLLENKGLIRDSKLFVIQEKLSVNAGEIVPGIYELNTNMTAEQMIEIMAGDYISEEKDTEASPLSYNEDEGIQDLPEPVEEAVE